MGRKAQFKYAGLTDSSGRPAGADGTPDDGSAYKLELVVKGDAAGTAEAVTTGLASIDVPGVGIQVIQTGVGPVSKSDVLMAQTGSRLIIGFNVDVNAKMQAEVTQSGVEIRLYDTIYRIIEDIRALTDRLIDQPPVEKLTAKAEVIATFKARHGGIILGCEVKEGAIAKGDRFRVISAMGPVYTGIVESLQIDRNPVKLAKAGRQAGIQVSGWNRAKVGDRIECFEPVKKADEKRWHPRPGVFRFYAK